VSVGRNPEPVNDTKPDEPLSEISGAAYTPESDTLAPITSKVQISKCAVCLTDIRTLLRNPPLV